MVPSDTLRTLEEEKRAPAPRLDMGKAIPATELLAQYTEVEKTIKTGRVARPVTFDAMAVPAVGRFLNDPRYCPTMNASRLSDPAMTVVMKSQKGLDYKLALFSATLFANTSMIQHFCGSAGGDQVPGYGLMAHYKGLYTELGSTRKLTPINGQSREQTAAVQRAVDAFANTLLNQLPADVQEQIKKLTPGDRMDAAADYAKAHPDQIKPAAKGLVQGILTQASRLRNQSSAEENPLAFLRLLREGEVYFDIYKYSGREGDQYTRERYLATVSGGGKSRTIELGPATPIDSAIVSFLSRIAADGARGIQVPKADKEDSEQAWKGLGSLVRQPLLAALPQGTKYVWISPDSSLALVPFASLVLDMGSPVTVTVVPSAYEFAHFRSEPVAKIAGRALLVGGLDYGQGRGRFKTLPGTETEVKAVSQLASGAGLQTVTLSGREATRSFLLQRIQDAQILHLATHGYWSTPTTTTVQDALGSAGLALSMANSEAPESTLTAADIFKFDLSGVQLVALSACSSGEGRRVDGQGLLGFQAAFMAAGVRTVLLSLWSVPDEATSVLMHDFYQALWTTPGISKAGALRKAQERLRGDVRFKNVRDWGAWVLVGDGD